MEDKKVDLNSIIGFILIFGILIWIMYRNKPSEEAIAADKAKKELVDKRNEAETAIFSAEKSMREYADKVPAETGAVTVTTLVAVAFGHPPEPSTV
mgnify:CR=1 FL=1